MANAGISEALQQYKSVGVTSAVEEASPHRLVQMLLDGAVARVVAANGYMARGDMGRKGESISLAIAIIDGLKGSLDLEGGGEIATNLEALYDYMVHRLFHANINNDVQVLEEVRGLLRGIKEAWDSIPEGMASGEVQPLRPHGQQDNTG